MFPIIFSLFLATALYEYYRLIDNKENPNRRDMIFNIAAGMVIFLTYLFYRRFWLIALLVFIYLTVIAFKIIISKQHDSLQKGVLNAFGQLYITLPFLILTLLSADLYGFISGYNYQIYALFIFIFIWINDTFAYLTGSLIGKRKLLEHVSPKKTIEGFIGGLLFTTLAGFLMGSVNNDFFSDTKGPLFWIFFAIVVSVFGTLGDLFESLIKRTYNTKDSGRVMPGHGGILDRMDSLLIAIPAAYIFIKAWEYFPMFLGGL